MIVLVQNVQFVHEGKMRVERRKRDKKTVQNGNESEVDFS
jgi:hypothetical protein